MYIADWYNHRVRKVTISTGIITTTAGTGTASYSGDNGQATSAALNYPAGVTVDSLGNILTNYFVYLSPYSSLLLLFLFLGNVYIADQGNHRVRKVTVSTGIITTFAGTGASSSSGDNGAATSSGLNSPCDVTIDSAGAGTTQLFFCNFNSYVLLS